MTNGRIFLVDENERRLKPMHEERYAQEDILQNLLTDYPDLFAAGANLFGVVNFATFFANTEPWMAAISTVEYGDPVKDKELLEQLSPIHKVDRVIAPTIVLHGANDTNVPVVEAEQVVENLQERGVPVKYVLFPDEGHGWGKVENRVTSDVEIVRWFEEHL